MNLWNRRDRAALWGNNIGKGILILAAGIVFGTILLTLAYMLPVNPENRQSSYEIFEDEGWYPRTSVISGGSGNHFLSFYPDVLDNSSDKIMLTTAMDTSSGSPLVRAMESYSEYVDSYSYYWHGYVAILRPLFLLFDFSELRTLNGACQILVVMLLVLSIRKEKGIGHVFALLTSYILLNPRTVAMGMQYTWIFYIAWGGTLLLLAKRNYFEKKDRYLCFFIVLGMLTSYLDLLTYPLYTWGFPLIWWIVVRKKEQKELQWVKDVIVSGIAWIAGYAGMWAAKWGIATLVLKKNIFAAAIDEIFLRSGMAETEADNLAARWNAIYANWRHYAYKIYAILLIGWLVWWIGCSLRKKWRKSSKRYALFLIGSSSIVWYFVLSNHTALHHFFTFRIYGVSVLAFLMLVLESVDHFRENKKLSGTERLAVVGLIGGSAILGCLFTLFAKEEVSITNGTESFYKMRMNRSFEMEFVPSFNTVGSVDLGLECDSRKGQYEVKLWEGDQVKYLDTFFLENSDGGNYQGLTTWWVLKHGETYRVTVEAVGTDAPVYVWLTEGGAMPLTELGAVSVDGVLTEGQLLMGIRYLDRHYVPRARQIFVLFTWSGIFMGTGYLFWGGRPATQPVRQKTKFKR